MPINDYWENNGINVWFAVKNADGEYGKFDGSEGPLRTCTVYICAEYYGHYAEIEMFDVFYAVAPVGIREVTSVEWLSFDRKVILEEEKNSGSWKDLVNITYIFAETDNYEEGPLSEFLETYTGFTAELVYDNEMEIFKVVVTGPYAYYRQNNIVVVPDNEANKLTNVYITESSQYIMADAQPVAGKDFRLTAEYGYGYKTTEIEDYSAVTVREIEVYGYNHTYEISYMDFKCYAEFYAISEVSIGFNNVEYIAYEKNGDLSGVRFFGQIYISYNYGDMTGNYDCEGKTLAELNAEFEIIGVEIVVSGLDLSLGTEEHGTVTVSDNGENPCEVIAIEINRTFVENVSLSNVVYTSGCDLSEVRIDVGFEKHFYLNEQGAIVDLGGAYHYDTTVAELNEYYAQYGMTFELIGLDTSLPAKEKTVYIKVNNAMSNEVIPSLVTE